MPYSSSLPVKRTPAATSSLAVGSRIAVRANDSAVPAAARRHLLVNRSIGSRSDANTANDSAVPAAARRHLPVNRSIGSRSDANTADDIATLTSKMSISKPTAPSVNSTSVVDRIAERRRRVVAAANSTGPTPSTANASVHDRIAERRRRVAADTSSNRPTPSVSSVSALDRISDRRRRVELASNSTKSTPSANTASVHDRIAERRRRVGADIAPSSARQTSSVKVTPPSILKSSSTSSRVQSLTTTTTTSPASTLQLPSSAVDVTIPTAPAATSKQAIAAVAAPVKIAPRSILKSTSAWSGVMPQTISSLAPASQLPSTSSAVTAVGPVVVATVPEAKVTAAASTAPDLVASGPDPNPAVPISPRRYGFVYSEVRGSYRQQTEHIVSSRHITGKVVISDKVYDADSLLPSAATGRKARVQLTDRSRPATIPLTRTPVPGQQSPVFLPHTRTQLPTHFSPVFLTLQTDPEKRRGEGRYCPARPRSAGPRRACGYAPINRGRRCYCHGTALYNKYHVDPRTWETTPAESGVDPKPPHRPAEHLRKKVTWDTTLTRVFSGVKPREACIPMVGKTTDKTPRERDFPEGFPLID